MAINKFTYGLLFGASLLVLSGCNTSTSAVDSAKETKAAKPAANSASTTVAAAAPQKATDAAAAANAATNDTEADTASPDEPEIREPRIIKREGKVENRGVYIKILVNRNPITNFDIKRRAEFLKLRRVSGDRNKIAEQEMIEQILKLQEAKRSRSLATDAMVESAFSNFAKRNRASTAQLSSELNRLGIGADHFKEFLRTQISWQRAVSGRFQAETMNLTERDAITQLRKTGAEKPEVTEYNFKQIVFVVPQAQRNKSTLAARRAEATAFRQRYTGCDSAIELAKQLRDVSVIDRKRIMGPELPERWKDEVTQLDANNTSRIKDTDKGVEFIAVCNTRQVNDDRAAQITTQSGEFENFDTKGSALDQKYLKQLKSIATIIYQ